MKNCEKPNLTYFAQKNIGKKTYEKIMTKNYVLENNVENGSVKSSVDGLPCQKSVDRFISFSWLCRVDMDLCCTLQFTLRGTHKC